VSKKNNLSGGFKLELVTTFHIRFHYDLVKLLQKILWTCNISCWKI